MHLYSEITFYYKQQRRLLKCLSKYTKSCRFTIWHQDQDMTFFFTGSLFSFLFPPSLSKWSTSSMIKYLSAKADCCGEFSVPNSVLYLATFFTSALTCKSINHVWEQLLMSQLTLKPWRRALSHLQWAQQAILPQVLMRRTETLKLQFLSWCHIWWDSYQERHVNLVCKYLFFTKNKR